MGPSLRLPIRGGTGPSLRLPVRGGTGPSLRLPVRGKRRRIHEAPKTDRLGRTLCSPASKDLPQRRLAGPSYRLASSAKKNIIIEDALLRVGKSELAVWLYDKRNAIVCMKKQMTYSIYCRRVLNAEALSYST